VDSCAKGFLFEVGRSRLSQKKGALKAEREEKRGGEGGRKAATRTDKAVSTLNRGSVRLSMNSTERGREGEGGRRR